MLGMVVLGSVLPVSGNAAQVANGITNLAIGLLFFLHGARLSRQAVWDGIRNWRLHVVIFALTFILFPLLGLLLKPLWVGLLNPTLYLGLLYICLLPSTVQSSIAFTALAQGNVPAAVCSASASNLIGILLTPLLVGLFLFQTHTAAPQGHLLHAVSNIVLLLLVPFVAGQLLQPWIGDWIRQQGSWLKRVDQGSILLVVYTAFSQSVVEGLWHDVSTLLLTRLLIACAILLALVMGLSVWMSRRLGFNREDEITIVFCGSKKSLASGLPMAKVLFAGQPIGLLILPLIIFHQLQLMVCAVVAQHYAKRASLAQKAP